MKPSVSRQQFDITIVIPAYREAQRIGKTLDELAVFLRHDDTLRDKRVELLVVSADSPDATHDIVRAKAGQFEHLALHTPGPRVGKGRDVRHGMLKANGKAVIFMDADLATPLHHVAHFYRELVEGGHDMVIGTRNLLSHHPNHFRRLLSNAGNALFRVASGLWIEDSQCGFKMFTDKAATMCFSRLTILGWGFDMEVLAIAKANRLKIKTRRIDDWVSVEGSKFTDSFIKNSLVSLHELSRIFWNRLRRTYVVRT